MLRFDTIFSHLKGTLKLPDSYDVANIRFDCLRDIMDSFEDKCGHLSDYGLIYVKYLATACEYHQSQTIINTISC